MSAAAIRSYSSNGSPKPPQRQAYFPRTSSYSAPSPSEQVKKNADAILKVSYDSGGLLLIYSAAQWPSWPANRIPSLHPSE